MTKMEKSSARVGRWQFWFLFAMPSHKWRMKFAMNCVARECVWSEKGGEEVGAYVKPEPENKGKLKKSNPTVGYSCSGGIKFRVWWANLRVLAEFTSELP